MKPQFYIPSQDRKLQQVGKTGDYSFMSGSDEQVEKTQSTLIENSRQAWDNYQSLLDIGVAKEVARMCLPLNTMTKFYATCNARSLMNFLSLRTEVESAAHVSHPQWEIAQVATKMEDIFAEKMPITYKAYCSNGRIAP